MKRLFIGGGTGLVIGVFFSIISRVDVLFTTSMLNGYEYRSYDARMRLHARETEEASLDSIVIIDIEQNSIQDLGNYKDWPQANHGRLVKVVSSGKPKAILFDIIFDREDQENYNLVKALRDDNPSSDSTLAERVDEFMTDHHPDLFINATQSNCVVYHSLVFEQSDSLNFLYKMDAEPQGYDYQEHLINIPEDQAIRLPTAERMGNTFGELLSASKGTGSTNFPQDADGIIRRAPTAIYFSGPGHVYPSLPLAAAMDILGVPPNGLNYDFQRLTLTLKDTSGHVIRSIPIDHQGRMYVNYFGYFKSFSYLPYSYCMNPSMLAPSYWKDRIAIVGSSLPGLMDLKNTPVQESFAGVEIHANVLHSLLQDQFVRVIPVNISNVMIIILCLIIGSSTGYLKRPFSTILLLIVITSGWVIFVYARFWSTLVMWEVVRPIVALTFSYVGVFLYNYLIAEKDRRFLKTTFSTYISPALIENMYQSKQFPILGGDEGYHTALFSDIQSFSTFSEILSASDLVELLNEYLTELTDVLIQNNGTLDKYIGDAIVAFYGAPAPVRDHEYRACITALQTQTRLGELRKSWKSQGDRWPSSVHEMQCRIGINSGNMVTGNMGSTKRMNYTMMGDTVNIASRLESSAKQYGVSIQVGEQTYSKVKDLFEWRFLDNVCVKGKNLPIKVYELLAEKGQLNMQAIQLVSKYQDGINLFYEQRWDEAIEAFTEAEQYEIEYPGRLTNPSRARIERCELMKISPPGSEWDKIWYLTGK